MTYKQIEGEMDNPSNAATAPIFENRSHNEYYISPSGDDANIGSQERPWKTLKKAIESLQPGQTGIFLDGEYIQDNRISFVRSGTASQRIHLKAQNLHKAKLIWKYSQRNSAFKFLVNRSFITIEGFEITQEKKYPYNIDSDFNQKLDADGNPTVNHNDILLLSRPYLAGDPEIVEGTIFKNNFLHNVFEECIKGHLSKNILIQNNICTDSDLDGIDLVNVDTVIIEQNTIKDTGRSAILAKGGSRNIVMRNNLVISELIAMTSGAVYLGGSAGIAAGMYFPDSGNPYEIYSSVAYNNIIFVNKQMGGAANIAIGIMLEGAINSAAFNNTIINADIGLAAKVGGNPDWTTNNPPYERPGVVNSSIINNVVAGASIAGESLGVYNGAIKHRNLFSNSAGVVADSGHLVDTITFNAEFIPTDSGGLLSEGQFVDFQDSNGNIFDITKDRIGNLRCEKWDMGAAQVSVCK